MMSGLAGEYCWFTQMIRGKVVIKRGPIPSGGAIATAKKGVYFLVVAQTDRSHPSVRNCKVLHKSYDLEASKAYLLNNFPRGPESNYPQRMIAEVVNGVVTKDPHKVGGENQGRGLDANFNKFWW